MNDTLCQSNYYKFNQFDGLTALNAQGFNSDFAPHYHNTYQVTLNRSGIFENQIMNKLLRSMPNSIAISHPEEVHATQCSNPQGHSFFTLYLPPSLFESNQSNQHFRFEHVIQNNGLVRIMQQIYRSISMDKPPKESELFMLIERLKKLHVNNNDPHPESGLLANHAIEHYLEPYDLDLWSQSLGLNKFKLLRQFKLETGMTPNQFIHYHRIEKSKEYLKQGCSIIDAALECGFYDSAHYYKVFKKMMGVTPLTYQQACDPGCNIVQDSANQ